MKLREVLDLITEASNEIGAGKVYLCGGVARDKYMKKLENISDIDVTSGNSSIFDIADSFERLISKEYNIKRDKLPDGHSTVYLGNIKIDFSSNFITSGVEKIVGRKLSNMEQELFSRDFTCNALLMSFDLNRIFDPTGLSVSDIKNKKIKTCLAPEITLTSNRNRVVRAIYLACKLDFDIDNSIIEYVKSNPDSITLSSNKSIQEKMSQAYSKDADKAKYYIEKMGLAKYLPQGNK